jgi:hypothetical protein
MQGIYVFSNSNIISNAIRYLGVTIPFSFLNFYMFVNYSEASVEFSKLVILNGTSREPEICIVAVNMFSES